MVQARQVPQTRSGSTTTRSPTERPLPRRRLGDLGKGLVPDDPALGHALIQVSLEDVEIGAADAHALHLEHGLARPRLWLRSRARSEAPCPFVE